MSQFAKEIKSNHGKAWKYFIEFYSQMDGNLEDKITFEELPFELQFGVFLRFFDSINTDVQLYAIEQDVLKESIKEAFETYEEYLFLDS